MNETELELMVVRLTGDGSSYQSMMQQAEAATKRTTGIIDSQTKEIEKYGDTLKGFAGAAVGALSVLGARAFLSNAMDMFAQTETTVLKLKAAITANGGAVDATLAQYQEFAKQLRLTTGASGDETLALLKKAEALGLTGRAAEQATEQAYRLAAGGDADVESTLRITASLQQGDTQRAMMFARAVPALRRIRDETEFVNKAQQIMNIGQTQMASIMNSTEGVMRRYAGVWKALTKQFGEYVSEAVIPVIKWMTELISKFLGLDPVIKRIVVYLAFAVAGLLAIGPAIATISATVGPFFTFMMAGWKTLMSVLPIITGLFGTIAGAVGWWIIPLVAGIVAVVALVGVLIDRMGGLTALWGRIKSSGGAAWEWVKAKAMAFVAWITPFMNSGLDKLYTVWRYLKLYAGIAWDYVQARIATFLAWAMPGVTSFGDFLVQLWDKVVNAATIAWDWIKEKAGGFFTWITPIVVAWWGYMEALWSGIADAAALTWEAIKSFAEIWWEATKVIVGTALDFIVSVWTGIANSANINWGLIKDVIVLAFVSAEFVLRNFRQVASFLWLSIRYGSVVAFNNLAFFFTDTLPALLTYTSTNWRRVFSGMFEGVTNALSVLSIDNLTDLLTGRTSPTELIRRMHTELQRSAANMPPLELPRRTIGEIERDLRREFETQGAALAESYATFRDRRLAEINAFEWPGLTPEAAAVERARTDAARSGEQIGNAFTGGIKQSLNIDWVLRYSGEAYRRIAQYQETLMNRNNTVRLAGQQPNINNLPAGPPANTRTPMFKLGGKMLKDGMAYLHANERVLNPDETRQYEQGIGNNNVPAIPQYFGLATLVPQSVFTITSMSPGLDAQAQRLWDQMSQGERLTFGEALLFESLARQAANNARPVTSDSLSQSLLDSIVDDDGGTQTGALSSSQVIDFRPNPEIDRRTQEALDRELQRTGMNFAEYSRYMAEQYQLNLADTVRRQTTGAGQPQLIGIAGMIQQAAAANLARNVEPIPVMVDSMSPELDMARMESDEKERNDTQKSMAEDLKRLVVIGNKLLGKPVINIDNANF